LVVLAAMFLLGFATGLAVSFLPADSLRDALKFVSTLIVCKDCSYVGTDKVAHEKQHLMWARAQVPGPIPLEEEK